MIDDQSNLDFFLIFQTKKKFFFQINSFHLCWIDLNGREKTSWSNNIQKPNVWLEQGAEANSNNNKKKQTNKLSLSFQNFFWFFSDISDLIIFFYLSFIHPHSLTNSNAQIKTYHTHTHILMIKQTLLMTMMMIIMIMEWNHDWWYWCVFIAISMVTTTTTTKQQ